MSMHCFSADAAVSSQRGVGLVEVLVALLVMSIGLLGYAGLQLRALGSTEDAHYRTQAIVIAQDLAERMSANPQARAAYLNAANWSTVSGFSGKPVGWDNCSINACGPNAMAVSDILQVSWQSAWLLPLGQVAVAECVAGGPLCVTVAWRDTTPASCTLPNDDCIRLEMVSWEAL
jgi:type IV pilus assembly protein PilV